MKTLIIMTILVVSAFAQRNPQIRTCNITGGNFSVLNIQVDKIGHCNYGDASVDTISLMDKVYENKESMAVKQFLDGVTDCRGIIITGFNNVETALICYYNDKSSIRLSTLNAGNNSPANKNLVEALNSQI